jgi:hypothetical protein
VNVEYAITHNVEYIPTRNPMILFKDTGVGGQQMHKRNHNSADVLVISVPNPRKRTRDADHNS